MKFPIIKANPNPKSQINVFGGLNVTSAAEIGEFLTMKNLTSDKYPCLCPSIEKNSVQLDSDITTIQAIITVKNDNEEFGGFTGVANGKFYYQNTHIPFRYSFMSMSAADDIQLVDFNGSIIIHPYMYIFEYNNPFQNSHVYPMAVGEYSQPIYVSSSEDGNRYTTFRRYNGTSWSDFFSVGDKLQIKVDNGLYPQLEPHYIESKYYDKNTSGVVSATVSSINGIEMDVTMANVKGEPRTIFGSNGNTLGDVFASGTIRIFKYIPTFSKICCAKNRLWGVTANGENIYASAPGKPSDFFRYAGLSTDSWCVESEAADNFTGICSFRDNVFAFKKKRIYQIYGSHAMNFNIPAQFENRGCIDQQSICKTDYSLYFLDYDGLYEYSGATPVNVSRKMDFHCSSGSCFTDGNKVYVSVNDDAVLYAYDILRQTWHVEDNVRILGGFMFGSNMVYASENAMFISGSNYLNSWEAVSIDITENTIGHKGINNLFIRLFNSDSSFVEVYTSVNDGDFIKCAKIEDVGDFTVRVPVRLKKGDKYKIKIKGEGHSVIKNIERRIFAGGSAFTRKG